MVESRINRTFRLENGCKRYRVLESLICRATKESALHAIKTRLASGEGGYICFSNVHTVVTALNNKQLQKATNESFMSLPDGKPIYWVGRKQGHENLEQVAGPDFFGYCLKNGKGLKHFLYGSTKETLEKLKRELAIKYPNAEVVGAYAPPFRPLLEEEKKEIIKMIKSSGADLIWVGLGAPKQEIWMHEMWRDLKPAILLGVGAAFDFYAGTTKRAPDWVQRIGLEWMHRLLQEPSRLWRRYLVTNSAFLFHLIMSPLIHRGKK